MTLSQSANDGNFCMLKQRTESEPQEVVRTEVNAYLQVKVGDEVDDDPLIFWKNAKGLDHLKQLAKVILTRSASPVDVECMFSAGLILNGKRSRLSVQSADALFFIHDNFFYSSGRRLTFELVNCDVACLTLII